MELLAVQENTRTSDQDQSINVKYPVEIYVPDPY
jgi:hypothetical protein